MNQKEIKVLIYLFLFLIQIFYKFLEITIICIACISLFIKDLIGSNRETGNLYQPSHSKEWLGYALVILALIISAGIISKNTALSFWQGMGAVSLFIFLIFVIYQIYCYFYFFSKKFNLIKSSIKDHTKNCNDLNDHINDLIFTNLNFSSYDYGDGFLHDQSNFKFKRREWSKIDKGINIHNCSSTVLKNASNQPFKYLCKYFNIKANEETLSAVESALNDVLAANQGQTLLEKERERIVTEMESPLPSLMLHFSKERLMRNLGFDPIALNEIDFPLYTFRYVSPGGNSSYEFNIILDIENLEKFIVYLGDIINFRKTVEGQRALMTQSLREKIKRRDNYTCKYCGASTVTEKNLLLEIDHIIPLSRGGVTSEKNLQTLCWRCNRSKGSKTPTSNITDNEAD